MPNSAAPARRFGPPVGDQAGMEILDRGGNAVDAAIATAFALAVVDQAASGLGGGGFMIIYEARDKRAHALDFRETAPEAAHADLYVRNGKPAPSLSLTGALAVAVPGEVAGLLAAMKRFGSLAIGGSDGARYSSGDGGVPAGCRPALCHRAASIQHEKVSGAGLESFWSKTKCPRKVRSFANPTSAKR